MIFVVKNINGMVLEKAHKLKKSRKDRKKQKNLRKAEFFC
jgi:hypothetical protein